MGEPEFIHGWSGACSGDNYRLLRRLDGFLILEFEGDNGEWFLAGEPIDEEVVIGELARLAAENYELKSQLNESREDAELVRESYSSFLTVAETMESERDRLRDLLDEAGCAICSLTCGYPKEVDDTLLKRIQEALADCPEGGE